MGYFCIMHVVLGSFLHTEIKNVNCENDMFVFGIVMFNMEW